MRGALGESSTPLTEAFDVALLDLDGVVYVGPDAVPGAAEALGQARTDGMRLAFVTNNAARPPQVVADHLTELGVAARPAEIVTSAQAAARHLAERLPGGARVLVVGTTGLIEALRERGLSPVESADGQVDAVVQGYSPDLDWHRLAEGAIALNRGVPWVATNADPTVPSPRGPLPGNGSLVAALRTATRREPTITGKPDPTMHREMMLRSQAQRPLVVGDRLDTDIEGANAVGCPSLLVFTGVTTVADLLDAGPSLRPTYVSADLDGLLHAHVAPVAGDGGARCGRWAARVDGSRLTLSAESADAAEPGTGVSGAGEHGAGGSAGSGSGHALRPYDLDAVRALCLAAWNAADAAGEQDGSGRHRSGSDAGAPGTGRGWGTVEAADEEAGAVLARLGLAQA